MRVFYFHCLKLLFFLLLFFWLIILKRIDVILMTILPPYFKLFSSHSILHGRLLRIWLS